ncbi:MAG: hypothetical protein KAU95_00905, partial [Candidatus Aenigmarchaeota archaeon]|nr:hypothetical protein [Candidatus Aenigmarchaeota archaeon]
MEKKIDYEKLLKEAEKELKREGVYAPVKNTELKEEGIETAAINFRNNVVYINPEGVKKYEDALPPEEIIKGMLEHEYSHKINYPYDLKRIVFGDIIMKKLEEDAEIRNWIIQRYADMAANLKLWNRNEGKELKKLYGALEDHGDFDVLEKMFYKEVTKHDFGRWDEKLEDSLEKLYKIDFLSGEPVKNFAQIEREMKKFYKIVKPLIPPLEERNGNGDRLNPEEGKEMDGQDISGEEVEKIVRELIESDSISTEEAKDYLESGDIEHNKGDIANFVVYDALSGQYPIKIKKSPIVESKGLYPHSYGEWSPTDPVEDIDPFASLGKIALPPITKKTVRKPMKIRGKKEKLNDCLIALDV